MEKSAGGPKRSWKFEYLLIPVKPKVQIGPSVQSDAETCGGARSTRWRLWFSITLTILVLSLVSAIAVWCTDPFMRYIDSELALFEGGTVFETWRKPPFSTRLKVYIFNYTNPDEVVRGREVPHVQQLGPFVYEEWMTRTNLKFDEKTVSFQENRTHKFIEEESAGSLDDILSIPNIPYLGFQGRSAPLWERLSGSMMSTALSTNTFVKAMSHEVIWGFDDSFSYLTRSALNIFKPSDPPKQFGILTERRGLSKQVIRIGRQKHNLGVVQSVDGEDSLSKWNDASCDSINGTEGHLHPAHWIRPGNTIQVFQKTLCRKLPLAYTNRVITKDGFEASQFVMPNDVFASPEHNPDNKCFCQEGFRCPPDGVSSMAPCLHGAPVVMSYPHFTHGDPSLVTKVTGLTPNKTLYRTYSEITDLGLAADGVSMIQIGLQVDPTYMRDLRHLQPGTVFPIAWIELESGEMTADVKKLFYLATVVAPRMSLIVSGLSLLVAIISFLVLLFML